MFRSVLSFQRVMSGSISMLGLALAAILAFFAAEPAFAQAAGAPGQPAWSGIVMMIVPLAILYFFMIRPQMKRQKSHQEYLTKLKRGDEVLTAGGVLGRIEGLTDLFVTLEIAPDVRIKVLRSQIMGPMPSPNANAAEVKA